MKDYKKAGKVYLQLTEIFYPMYGDKIQFYLGELNTTGIYMHIIKRAQDGIYKEFISVDIDNPNIEEITKQVKKMFEPKFIPIKNTCMDLIGKEVWLDKKEPSYIVESIDRAGVWLDNNYPIDLNRLWVKE